MGSSIAVVARLEVISVRKLMLTISTNNNIMIGRPLSNSNWLPQNPY